MRPGLVLVTLAALVVGGACRKDRQRRAADAGAAVEVVAKPLVDDAGASSAIEEIEPNDGDDVATALAPGATVRGRIEPDADVDRYRVEVAEAGAMVVELTGIDGVDLALELADGAGAVIGRSDRAGARVREGLPNVGVAPGRYVLTVRGKKIAAGKKGKRAKAPVDAGVATQPAPVYELTARIQPIGQGAEREPNDDRGTAAELIVGDTVTGYVGWAGDADVWKLSVETLSDKNALDVQISAVEGVGLELEITDGIGTVLATRKAPRGQALLVQNMLPVVAEGAPPFYYLTVSGDRSNPETSYTLHATAQVLGPDPELEPNDNADKPQMIAADRTVVHASWTPGDVDCFTLAPAEAERTVEFSIDTPADIDLAAEILVDGTSVAKADKGKKGVLEKISAPVPAGAKVVLRVRNPDTKATIAAKYDVTVAESSGTGDNAP